MIRGKASMTGCAAPRSIRWVYWKDCWLADIDRTKTAAVVYQTRLGLVRAALHFAHEDHMVAFRIAAAVMAFKPGRHWEASWSPPITLERR